jgi:hypothetical protein
MCLSYLDVYLWSVRYKGSLLPLPGPQVEAPLFGLVGIHGVLASSRSELQLKVDAGSSSGCTTRCGTKQQRSVRDGGLARAKPATTSPPCRYTREKLENFCTSQDKQALTVVHKTWRSIYIYIYKHRTAVGKQSQG